VWGSHVRSSNLDGCSGVSELLEGGENSGEGLGGPADVFPEDPFRPDLADDSDELEEQPAAGSIEASALSCDREVLARAAASDAINDSTPGFAVEGADISPDRRWSHAAFRHTRRQASAGIRFDLHVNDCSSAVNNSVDSEIESPSARKEGANVELTHTQAP
jgi:hypothetical protein